MRKNSEAAPGEGQVGLLEKKFTERGVTVQAPQGSHVTNPV